MTARTRQHHRSHGIQHTDDGILGLPKRAAEAALHGLGAIQRGHWLDFAGVEVHLRDQRARKT